MRKILTAIILSTALSLAEDGSNGLKIEILKKIITGIQNSESKKIWSDDPEIMAAFHRLKQFEMTEGCEEADVIILDKKENLSGGCLNHNVFVLNYELLNDIPESFGAFFWKKGRPNIVFIEPRLNKHALKLSAELMPYMEKKVW